MNARAEALKISRGTKKTHSARKKKRRIPPYLADEALALLLAEYEFESVLDVGCGAGLQARVFRDHGKTVTTVSLSAYGGFVPDFIGDIADFRPPGKFDVVWCSHALEHQSNVETFLQRLARFLKPEGILAITVPPARHRVVGGHLTMWNTGLLLYNLVVAGFDCSLARTREYGYNISVLVRMRSIALPLLGRDIGDIEKLAAFFPMPVSQGFDGRIREIRWSAQRHKAPGPVMSAQDLVPSAFRAPASANAGDPDVLTGIAAMLRKAGHVLEFGVFEGRSIRALAQRLPERAIHGFDSFEGLPSAWARSAGSTYPAGHFRPASPPSVPSNVTLWKGFFDRSLPAWLQDHEGAVALVHIDCDLYESTRIVLSLLDGRIAPGTILVFDELCDWCDSGIYTNWRTGEWRALVEWMASRRRCVRPIVRGPRFAGAVEVVN